MNTPNRDSYLTSTEHNYLTALWARYDAADDSERVYYRRLIEMHVMAAVLRKTLADKKELLRKANEPPPDSRLRPVGAGGGRV